MAFVARRNMEGKLVDCQVISGLGSGSLALSDLSDEDAESGTVQSYSNRSYVSPTVRYVASKDEDDTDSCSTFDDSHGRGANSDLESLVDYDEEPEEEPVSGVREDAQTINDYQSDVVSDDETVMCCESKTLFTPNRREVENDVQSIDGDTVCSSGEVDELSIGGFFERLTVEQPIVPPLNLQAEDAQSMSSIDSISNCRKTICASGQPDDVFSMGSLSSISVSRLMTPQSLSEQDNDARSHVTSRTFNLKSTTVRRDECSSASTCSWTDMYGGALKQAESRSNMVPSLSLNLSNTSSGSSTYFRNLDEEKERHGQEAYQEWVKRKERLKQQKQLAAKQEQAKREAEIAMRQRLAKERYQEWVRQKEQQQKKAATGSIKSTTSYGSCMSTSSCGGMMSNSGKPPRREPPEATRKRLEEWERIKTQQQQRERERERLKRQTEEQLEKQRKQKSEGAWQNWMKTVGKRPKPVPLNQGFDTLRGTISNIYVNPVQWVSNIDPHDSRGN